MSRHGLGFNLDQIYCVLSNRLIDLRASEGVVSFCAESSVLGLDTSAHYGGICQNIAVCNTIPYGFSGSLEWAIEHLEFHLGHSWVMLENSCILDGAKLLGPHLGQIVHTSLIHGMAGRVERRRLCNAVGEEVSV